MPLTHILKSYSNNPVNIIKNITWRFPKQKSRERHVFVIGAPRSGTTLMKSILCAHPQLTSINGETTGVFSYRNIFDKQNHFQVLKKQKINRDIFFEIINNSQDIVSLFDNFTNAYIKENHINNYEISFVEKINSPTLYRLEFIYKNFPYSKIIYVYRDGRDSYCSARNHPHVYQGRNVRQYASHWQNCIKARLNLPIKKDNNVFDVKYENLTTKPEKVVREIMEFIGKDYFPTQVEPQHYINAKLSQSKQHSNLAKPINSSSHNRWKKELSDYEIFHFEKIAGKQLVQLGYNLNYE